MKQTENIKHVVLIIEDHDIIISRIAEILRRSEIQFIFATNHADALKLFEANAHLLAFVALDGNLNTVPGEHPDTLVIARAIRRSVNFKGNVYVMSGCPDHNRQLLIVLGNKGTSVGNNLEVSKLDTVNEISTKVKMICLESKN